MYMMCNGVSRPFHIQKFCHNLLQLNLETWSSSRIHSQLMIWSKDHLQSWPRPKQTLWFLSRNWKISWFKILDAHCWLKYQSWQKRKIHLRYTIVVFSIIPQQQVFFLHQGYPPWILEKGTFKTLTRCCFQSSAQSRLHSGQSWSIEASHIFSFMG